MRYVITTDASGTVRLSKAGHWGNIPHGSEADAEAAIQADARGKRVSVERLQLEPLPPFRTHHTS